MILINNDINDENLWKDMAADLIVKNCNTEENNQTINSFIEKYSDDELNKEYKKMISLSQNIRFDDPSFKINVNKITIEKKNNLLVSRRV